MPKEYFILSLKWTSVQRNESCVWYRAKAAGYTCDIRNAGRFTEAEAIAHEFPGVTVAVSCCDAEAMVVHSVPRSDTEIGKWTKARQSISGEVA